MGFFTRLEHHDIAAIAGQYGIAQVSSFTAIAAGTINSNFRLDTGGETLFLRINEGKAEDAVQYEADLVEALAAAGVPAPRPRRAVSGAPFAVHDGAYVSVFPWLQGSHCEPAKLTPGHVAELGRQLAGLHLAGLPIAQRFERPSRYTFEEIIRRFEAVKESPRGSSDAVLAPALAAVADEIAWLRARDEIRQAATHGIIHGDLFPDNVLFAEGPGASPPSEGVAIAALIDFEQASSGSLPYDLAVCLNAWCYRDRGFDPALVAAMVAGYRRVRELSKADLTALEVEVRAAAMRFIVTRITDVYVPGVDNPAKDFRRYLDRLEQWRQVGAEGLRTWASSRE